jgi:transposase
VYFLLDLVDELDPSEILIPAPAKDPRGEKWFDLRMMTMLFLYAYCMGIVFSRKTERACYEDLAFRVMTGNQQSDLSRISEFRRRNLDTPRACSFRSCGSARSPACLTWTMWRWMAPSFRPMPASTRP